MKKRIIILALIVTLVLLMVALVACSRGGLCTNHKWEAYKVVDGNIQTEKCSICGVTRRLCYPFPHTYNSCVDNGDGTHTSSCGACGIDDVKDHTFTGTAPTVHDLVACDDCGAMFYFGTNHPLVDNDNNSNCDTCGGAIQCAHNYVGEFSIPADCENNGTMVYTCTLCGDEYAESVIAYGHPDEDLDCICDICDEERHAFIDELVSVDDSYHAMYCANNPEHVILFAHDIEEVGFDPDCENSGEWYRSCLECNYFTYTEYDPLGHIWNEWSYNGDGVTHEHICMCDRYWDDNIHCTLTKTELCTFEKTVTLGATCTEDGIATFTCTGCQYEYEEVIPATGHQYDNGVVTEPTCLQDGYTTFTCTECSDNYIANYVESAGHSSETIVVREATCVETGLITHRCTEPDCGYSYSENTELDRENGHIWADRRNIVFNVDEMCNGVTINAECTLCNAEKTFDIVSDVEHTWVFDPHTEGYTPASCDQEGVDTYYCATCDSFKDVITGYLEHQYVKTHILSDCTKQFGHSYYALICSVCSQWDEGFEEQVEAKPHTDEDGNYICDLCDLSTCEYCDDMDCNHFCDTCNRPVVDFCYDDDNDYLCDVCGNNLCDYHFDSDYDYICDTCGACTCLHDFTYTEYEVEDCNVGGYVHERCWYCWQIISTESYPPGHSLEHYSWIDELPTCTEEGTEVYEAYCYVCYETVEYECTPIPATGHNYNILSTTESTCVRNGSVLYHCSGCGDEYSEELELVGHTIIFVTEEPSCFEDGCVYEMCSECGNVFNTVEIHLAYGSHINEDDDLACDRCGWSYCEHHQAELEYNKDYHYTQCTECHAIIDSLTKHDDSNDDGACDTCGSCMHSFTVYEHDALNHWSKCDFCDAVVVAEHEHHEIGVKEVTCGDFGGIIYGCSCCDHTFIVETQEATREHMNIIDFFNEEMHWKECLDCGMCFEARQHSMIDDQIYYGCDYVLTYVYECGYECGYRYHVESDEYYCHDEWDGECYLCGQCDYHVEGSEVDEDENGLCDICGYCLGEHEFGEPTIEDPGCRSFGYTAYPCTKCHFVLKKNFTYKTDSIIEEKKASGEEGWGISWFDIHDYVVQEVYYPNCGYNGYTIYECESCGSEFYSHYTKKVGEHINVDENMWYCDVCEMNFCDEHIDEDGNYRCDKCNVSTCDHYEESFGYNHDYHWYKCMICGEYTYIEEHEEDWYGDGGYGCGYCDLARCEGFKDIDGDNLCDRCGLSKCNEHIDENGDYRCDVCTYVMCNDHVSDGHYYSCVGDYCHCEVCVKCGKSFNFDGHICDYFNGNCEVCNDYMCTHEDYIVNGYGYEGSDGFCDNCGYTMDAFCRHENVTINGIDRNRHYCVCDDCGLYLCFYHSYTITLVSETPFEGESCRIERVYTYVCNDCGYTYTSIVINSEHNDNDEDSYCDDCGEYLWQWQFNKLSFK